MKKSIPRKVILIFALALLIRLSFVFVGPQPEVANDAIGYDIIGWNLAQGRGFSIATEEPFSPTAYRPPVYPLFLASIFYLWGHSYVAVSIVQAIVGALTATVTFWIGRSIFDDERVALLGVLMFIFYPALIYYVSYVMIETLFTFVLSLTVMFFVKAMKSGKLQNDAYTGIFLGIATLCKPVTLLLPFLGLFVSLLIDRSLKKTFTHFLLISAVMVLVLMPWTVRNYVTFREILPVSSHGMGTSLWGGNLLAQERLDDAGKNEVREEYHRMDAELRAGLSEIEGEKKALREAIRIIVNNPLWYLKMVMIKAIKLWSYPVGIGFLSKINPLWAKMLIISYYLLLLGAIIGVLNSRKQWNRWLPLLSVIVYFTVIHALLHANIRYHIPVLPYVFIFASAGFVQALQTARAGITSFKN